MKQIHRSGSRLSSPWLSRLPFARAGATKKLEPPDAVAIVVLGTHRSGTSALTRIMSILGARLPQRLMEANDDNKAGYWEPVRLVELHDQMLKEAGSHWSDWRRFDPEVLGADRLGYYRQEIFRMLREEYNGAPLIVIKDPRICRFAPFFQDLLLEFGYRTVYVLTDRNPASVVASLGARDAFDTQFASLVTLRNVIDAEFYTRGQQRAFVSYEALLAEPVIAIERMVAELGIDWPDSVSHRAAEIRDTIRRDLQHHSNREAGPAVHPWLQRASRAIATLSLTGRSDRAVLRELDKISRQFESAFEANELLQIALAQTFRTVERHLALRHLSIFDARYRPETRQVRRPRRAAN